MFIKLSLLVFYTLLGKNLQFRRAVYGMMIVTVGIFIGSFFTEILRCIPLHKLWNYKVPGKCVNRQNYYYAKAALNILRYTILWKSSRARFADNLCAVILLSTFSRFQCYGMP